jgi:capsid assembly protease
MSSLPLWAMRLFNEPLALDRFKNDALIQYAQSRLSGEVPRKIDASAMDVLETRALVNDARRHNGVDYKPFAFDGHIAVIPVRGTLVQRSAFMDAESGLVGYDSIISQAKAARNDPDIGGIFMSFHTSGGETAGLFAAAEELASMTKTEGGKPFFAFIDERAASAGYVMASACDKIYGRRECVGGSIAAIINTVDSSKAYEKAGLEPISIRPDWADQKAVGSDGKIDSAVLDVYQPIVNEVSDMVVEFCAAMRGISEDSIKALRGNIFTGNDLIRHGLMDGIMSEREAWTALEDEIAAS